MSVKMELGVDFSILLKVCKFSRLCTHIENKAGNLWQTETDCFGVRDFECAKTPEELRVLSFLR